MKWFHACAFCIPLPDLVQDDKRHHPDCLWKRLMRALTRSPNGVAVAMLHQSVEQKGATEK